jgi:hypothetical protein
MTSSPPTRKRRNLLRATAFLLLIAALALLPPYINGERYRHRIADAMSQSLGRPVHIDTVAFHLLPSPGVTLGGLVVDENPAFGNEPVIRANVVEATLRLSSLWRRQIEISRLAFGVDSNGAGPSINIVRNAAGRWNLQDILMQAAHANTAPTTQTRPGPAPRFPYIEATGARVNLKLGDEKMPFSLTDADFALWLPSPQQWHIRLKATPSRTDTNASDTGSITLEGTLGRAATLADVPLNLTASWAHAPLGEATRVLSGDDQQWRGTLDIGATLTGTVGASHLDTTFHITDLRRADFVPADLLDVSAHCTSAADLTAVLLTNATCTIPNGGPQPLTLTAPALNLQTPATAAFSINIQQLPADWLLNWARLFTQQIPDMHVAGALNGNLQHTSAGLQPPADGDAPQWQGAIDATLDSVTRGGTSTDLTAKPVALHMQLQNAPAALQLAAVTLHPGGASLLTLSGTADATQIALHLTGTASADQLRAFGASLYAPLGDDLAASDKAPTHSTIAPIDITCTHPYISAQTCLQTAPAPPKKRPHRRR